MRRNRTRLLEAADSFFRERGADVSLDEVARRATVGIGTLYRHFPTREALLVAASDERLLALADTSRSRKSRDAKPGASQSAFLEQLVVHGAMYRGFATWRGVVLRSGSPGCHATSEEGQRLLSLAQRTGEVRADVSFDDLVCMATAISLAAADDPQPDKRVRRLVRMFVEGIARR